MFKHSCKWYQHDYFFVSHSRFGGYYECLNCNYRPSPDEYREWANA